jgi:prophage regulatory protein
MNINAEQFFDFFERQSKPQFPITIELWSVKEIAAWLKVTENHVRGRVITSPGFPSPIRLPSKGGNLGQPRWKAAKVIKWADQYEV